MGKKSSSVKYGSVLEKYAQFVTLGSEVSKKPKMKIGPLSLNLAIGDADGVPMGRFIQFVGKQSSGKSTLALDTIATYQKEHPEEMVLYVDFERSFEPDYAAACGVNLDTVLRIHPDTTEQGMDIIKDAIENEFTKLVIIDSVPAAMPSSELEKSYQDNAKMAGSAYTITRFCQRSIGLIDNMNATIILINQFRKSFNTLSREDEIPAGGLALQYASSLTLYLARIKTEDIKQTVQVLVKKNKIGSPQRRCEFFINYGAGIDHDSDILTLAEFHGIVHKTGAWYVYRDQKAQGIYKASETFPLEEIENLVLEKIRGEI